SQAAACRDGRPAAQDLHRKKPEVRAARAREVGDRDRYMSAIPKSEQAILLREERDGICTLTMNRPGQMNLLTSEMLQALQAAFDAIAGDKRVRVVILAANGKAFSAGHD